MMHTSVTPPATRAIMTEVRTRFSELRPSEQRIASALLDDPRAFAARSISEIAELAETSTTTVVRFTRRIGYARFKDLRRDLTEQNLRDRIALAGTEIQAFDISPHDGVKDVVIKVAASESLSIADTADALDLDALQETITAIDSAARVDVYGAGASGIVAVDLQRKLARIGRVALEWPEPHAAWTAAAVLGPHSVAVAISHSGATVDTVEFLRLARESGATTIAITNNAESPLAAASDIVLCTAARETAFRPGALGSRIAQLMVIDCLFIGIAQANYDGSVAALQKTRRAVQRLSSRADRA